MISDLEEDFNAGVISGVPVFSRYAESAPDSLMLVYNLLRE